MSLDKFELARELNHKFETTLRTKKLHFRGNFDSFSLISLAKETPEEGISDLKTPEDADWALNEIDSVLTLKRERKQPGEKNLSKNTPEKELQAGIIHSALLAGGWLPFNGLEGVGQIRFVTSELVLSLEDKDFCHVNENLGFLRKPFSQRDIRNDILGLDEEGNLVVVELKSVRLLSELLEQVFIFSSLLTRPPHRENIAQVVATQTGQLWKTGQIRKMIVWPHSSKPAKRTLSKLGEMVEKIIVIGYEAVNGADGGTPKYDSDDLIKFHVEQV
ncbi:MAG: hypothetical protein FDZ69_00375 [Deltaproteobacteria bacterium]|nr:MAG: hypothetical protein FDZ69_00375 [Deltaproteobacteria bacterium]